MAPNGNRDTMETSGGLVQYDYDSQNRLARVDYPDGSHSEYTYDNAGNRIELSGDAFNLDDLPAGTANYLYDDSDRLTGYSDDNITIEYEYDGDGNLCEKITKDGNDNITAHSQYFYDYSADLPRVLAEVDVLNGNVIDYTYGNRLYGKYDSAMYYYHQDGLNNILAVTDASGCVKNTYAYDDFGEVICKNETVSNSILFTGELVDESGLTYLRARFYDPTLGRFLTRDTYAGNIENPQSLNLYTYCANNPVLYIDPSGHMRCSQVDDLFGGIGQGIGDTVVSLLNSPKAILELGDAIISGEITTKQLIEAGLEGLVDDYIYVVKNAYILKPSADVSDATVSAYGKRLGYVISDIATAVAGGKAVKILSKTASGKKIAKALQKATGDENGARLGEGMNSTVQVPGRAQSRINVSNDGMKHVADRHFSTKNASQFTITQDELKSLLQSKDVVKTPVTRTLDSADGIRYVREVNVGRNIGLDKFNNYEPTSIMTVLTDKYGNLVTATPGVIK